MNLYVSANSTCMCAVISWHFSSSDWSILSKAMFVSF